MADPTSSIFNQKATEKLRSPDDLDKFVKVTTPSIWMALAACVILLIGLLAWGFFGAVTTNLATKAVVIDGKMMSFVVEDDADEISVGDVATINGERFEVSSVSALPLSRGEAADILGSDYLVNTLIEGDWAYEVTYEGPKGNLSQGIPYGGSIEVDRVAPISLILRNWG